MLNLRLATVVSAAFALAVGFVSQQASALICCSACEAHFTSACLHGCSPSCATEDEPADAHVVYDEAAGVCYVAGGQQDSADPMACKLPCVEVPDGVHCICKIP